MSWIADGSEKVTVQGDVVECKDGSGSSYNAMWKDGEGLKSGEAYWKIHFPTLEEGAFVGVTTEQMFGPGYKIRGLVFGGNLSDGSGALVCNFGPRFNANDTVGILASYEGDRLKIYFDHNDTPLGLAFDVPADCMPGGIHPCIKFSKSGSAKCTKTSPPSERQRSQTQYSGIEGSWKLQALTPSSDTHGVTLKLTSEGHDSYRGHLKVINGVMFQVNKSGGQWRGSGGASTMMAGPPEMMELERKLSQHVQSPTDVKVVGSELHFDSADLKSVWTRFDDSPQPYTGNPFERRGHQLRVVATN